MDEVIIWAQFAGAWLLVAGPLYQGSVELDELDIDREAIEGVKATALGAAAGRPSPWWWLFPPVMYLLHRRWTRQLRTITRAQLTQAQLGQITSFHSKATGWYTVAIGALLLAAGETWQATRHYDWPVWVFWLLIVVMLGGCLLNTAIRMTSGHRARIPAGAGAAPQPAAEQG
jgi:hypothetical protein